MFNLIMATNGINDAITVQILNQRLFFLSFWYCLNIIFKRIIQIKGRIRRPKHISVSNGIPHNLLFCSATVDAAAISASAAVKA